MPILRNNMILVVRGIKAFLNTEAGITRSAVPQPRQGRDTPAKRQKQTPQPRPKQAVNRLQPAVKPEQTRGRPKQARQQQVAEKDGVAARLSGGPAGEAVGTPDNGGIAAEDIVWLFGHGRSGSTWLVRMMRDLRFAVWPDPRLGDLFGHLYYERAGDRHRNSPQFVLGSNKEAWLGPMRSFILESASLRFPRLRKGGALIIKEVHATIGAPLLMEALPKSKMILLVRDPRDVVASHADASRPGGWVQARASSKRRSGPSAPVHPDVYAQGVARSYLHDIEKAKQAYDAHDGPKVVVRYEDLVSDTVGTMRRLCDDLGLAVEEKRLVRAVEKRSWDNIPEEQKGEGQFHRKGTPGGWKEDLTRQQIEIVEEATAPILDEFYPSEERMLPFVFRPGTHDQAVFRAVSLRNEYRLPESFDPEDVIVDVGTHIGSFCYAALRRGSENVYGFEPQKDNYEHAKVNLRSFDGRVHLYNKAVWRSDRAGDSLSFSLSEDTANTAGGNVMVADTGQDVETVAFDDVIRQATDDGKKRVRMLKLDCEGSEFPIVFTSQTLHLVDEIRGEYHEFGGDYDDSSIPEVARVPGYERYTIAELTDALERAGFTVESDRSGETNLGHFFATRVP